MATRSYVTLYIRTSRLSMCRLARWSKGRQFRSLSMAVMLDVYRESRVTHLVALRYTDSSLLMSVAVCGDHTVEAYSNCGYCGRTKVLYAVDFRSLFWTWIFLLMKPSAWFAFFEVLFMCVLHERSSDIVTARYFADGTLSSSIPCRRYLVGIGVLTGSRE